ncbi:hypothetical protein CKO15_07150 [Halorhodospira abdelmalekii]|uniref:hypothetical protein n=1 Tax=Halorhodospira abdelmalekii TaxID=421629 RepID=UPI001903D264|nr:hypothetical protein [Halorhodospira abdelmalekii]MBK1735065.1 hypothetical protein [Halorhodospira abdelmalekii]
MSVYEKLRSIDGGVAEALLALTAAEHPPDTALDEEARANFIAAVALLSEFDEEVTDSDIERACSVRTYGEANEFLAAVTGTGLAP